MMRILHAAFIALMILRPSASWRMVLRPCPPGCEGGRGNCNTAGPHEAGADDLVTRAAAHCRHIANCGRVREGGLYTGMMVERALLGKSDRSLLISESDENGFPPTLRQCEHRAFSASSIDDLRQHRIQPVQRLRRYSVSPTEYTRFKSGCFFAHQTLWVSCTVLYR